jgi:hypothetical protein
VNGYQESGVQGLAERPKAGRKDHAVSAETTERIVQTTLSPPPAGRTRWTTRLLGRKFELTSWTISKIRDEELEKTGKLIGAAVTKVLHGSGGGYAARVRGVLEGKRHAAGHVGLIDHPESQQVMVTGAP